MRLTLLILIFFVAITALPSGILLMSRPDGSLLGFSADTFYSPFKDFFIPGLLLTVIVGGSSIIAIFLIFLGHVNAYRFSLAAGLILFVWVIGQMMLIQYFQWLQGVYLALGVLISLLSYQLMGKAAW